MPLDLGRSAGYVLGSTRGRGWSAATSDSDVELYLREISRYQLLKIEEERELARRVRQGDQEARNEMVRANLRLVVSIAKNYVERGLSLLDLVEEGNIGLLKAVERFNPDEGCKFSTYASWWIKQTVRRALINKVKNVRVPAYMVELLTRWRRAVERLTQGLGRAPSMEEVADEVGLSAEKLPTLHRAIYAHGAGRRGEVGGFVQDIEDDSAVAPGGEDTMVDRTDGRTLDQMLSAALSEREGVILCMRFGVGSAQMDLGMADGQTATLDQIGRRIGLTRERVRQIEAQALKKLFYFLTGGEAADGPARSPGGEPVRGRTGPGRARGGSAKPKRVRRVRTKGGPKKGKRKEKTSRSKGPSKPGKATPGDTKAKRSGRSDKNPGRKAK